MTVTPARTLIVVLATLRLTRLVTRDKITEQYVTRHLRHRGILRKDDGDLIEHPVNLEAFLVEAMDCPFCSGFWLGLGVVIGEVVFGRTLVWRIATGALALNYLVGHISSKID